MTALAADRSTVSMQEGVRRLGVAASVLIYAGAIVMRNASGYATKGQTALGLIGVGRAEERVQGGSGAGDATIKVRSGTFKYANSASTDAITEADVGRPAFVVDDQTVARTSGITNGVPTRSPAGIIVGVDSNGVDVLFNEAVLRAVMAGFATYVPIRVATLVGTGVYRVISPVAGKVVLTGSITEGVLTTGDATLTPKINGVAVTGGTLTITQSGSAAGDKDFAAPSAANTVAEGDELSFTVGGTNATATVANGFFLIERA